jgi:hypothetical protein
LKEKITNKIRICAFKCFLLNNQKDFISLSIENIGEKFELNNIRIIKKEVNKLILSGLLCARWNDSNTLEVIKTESSNLNDFNYRKNIEMLENNIKQIAENNILLLEAGFKANN